MPHTPIASGTAAVAPERWATVWADAGHESTVGSALECLHRETISPLHAEAPA
jgi:hypothetical protein